MKINLIHSKSMTDEEVYQFLQTKNLPSCFMSAEEWKKFRLKQLKKEGKRWSK